MQGLSIDRSTSATGLACSGDAAVWKCKERPLRGARRPGFGRQCGVLAVQPSLRAACRPHAECPEAVGCDVCRVCCVESSTGFGLACPPGYGDVSVNACNASLKLVHTTSFIQAHSCRARAGAAAQRGGGEHHRVEEAQQPNEETRGAGVACVLVRGQHSTACRTDGLLRVRDLVLSLLSDCPGQPDVPAARGFGAGCGVRWPPHGGAWRFCFRTVALSPPCVSLSVSGRVPSKLLRGNCMCPEALQVPHPSPGGRIEGPIGPAEEMSAADGPKAAGRNRITHARTHLHPAQPISHPRSHPTHLRRQPSPA